MRVYIYVYVYVYTGLLNRTFFSPIEGGPALSLSLSPALSLCFFFAPKVSATIIATRVWHYGAPPYPKYCYPTAQTTD